MHLKIAILAKKSYSIPLGSWDSLAECELFRDRTGCALNYVRDVLRVRDVD
jgi:hypothetical protein